MFLLDKKQLLLNPHPSTYAFLFLPPLSLKGGGGLKGVLSCLVALPCSLVEGWVRDSVKEQPKVVKTLFYPMLCN